ncbi:MAG: YmdB family metallophosphoesterase, partial [Pygmaiobacter sp.]
DTLLAKSNARFRIVDFHAESTAEKLALSYYLDGRVSAVFGTHTHVPTADARVLPQGTGHITDVGMTGPLESVLGVVTELAIAKQKNHRPVRFAVAKGRCRMDTVLFTLDDTTGRCLAAEQILEAER